MAFADLWTELTSFVMRKSHSYSALPENVSQEELQRRAKAFADRHRAAVKLTMAAMFLTALGFFLVSFTRPAHAQDQPCDTALEGFQCETAKSHAWGQYSPFFTVPSNISAALPSECQVTFAQVLSRHAARFPTADKGAKYEALIDRIHQDVTQYGKGYEFIESYNYTFGADTLTDFGQNEMVNSGINFYTRYEQLARTASPFVRSSGEQRVVTSALNWTQGFSNTLTTDKNSKPAPIDPEEMVIIPEQDGFNNTLDAKTCTAFEEGPDVGDAAQAIWADVFAPAITQRLNDNLVGAQLTTDDTIFLMDMCPFDTVANSNGDLSKFCSLFTVDEWHAYDYYESLGKWYGHGNGNPLGATVGVGFVNELVARLTGQPVVDATTTNTTLDSSNETFPLDRALYADFSHDNTMVSIFAAMGLFNTTAPLSNTTIASPKETNGFSTSWVVPFAARMYVEKMSCPSSEEEMVRVLLNDRVIPLQNCDADELGRCGLSKFVDSLSFARNNGFWDQC
ncbi:histidine phosphatase superfamily [Xylariomycetidae sp. FL0641]|nr:histidine phosphatase superfamily [Xylariomycetidae sp. FL0641]